MSDSHTSLRELYDCSHPMVDSLVDAAMDCGAFGARLTGAGYVQKRFPIKTESFKFDHI